MKTKIVSIENIEDLKNIIAYSDVKQLKKTNLNIMDDKKGFHLLTHLITDYNLIKKVLETGLSVNSKNKNGTHAGFYIMYAKDKYKTLKLMHQYGLDLKQNLFYNMLHFIFGSTLIDSKEDETEITKIQLFILSKQPDLIHPIQNNLIQYNDSRKFLVLSCLTPETLKYLVKYRYPNLFDWIDNKGNNLAFYIMLGISGLSGGGGHHPYKTYYASQHMFINLLKIMNEKQINYTNETDDTLLSFVRHAPQITALHDVKFNFNKLDRYERTFLDKINNKFFHNIELDALIKCGSVFSKKYEEDFFNISADEFLKKYNWRCEDYNYIYNHHLYQKRKIFYILDKNKDFEQIIANKAKRL